MPIAHAPPDLARPLALLYARAHFIPWILLALVIVTSVAGTRREAPLQPLDRPPRPAAAQAVPGVQVHCDLRRGFVLQLEMHAQRLPRPAAPGTAPGQHTHGGTCRVQR
jgi:hypothetical protein